MQNNVTELTQKLLRSLDSNYNVVDMPTVLEIISQIEKVTITKELLETTRLGKHVNELRRNTTNESLAKRAKELLKKWRNKVLPDSNGQLTEKRPAKDSSESNAKRPRLNGQVELEFSDNSNSSFKDLKKRDVIVINSDSNSSFPDMKQDPVLEDPLPKKRGRKKGSRNHRSLIDDAETSFSNKLNVSRGNAKVKTTQELLADLHIKSNNSLVVPVKPVEDLNEKAAKLTERVSIIDQKLNANNQRYKNQKKFFAVKPEVKAEPVKVEKEEEIIVVDDEKEEEVKVEVSVVSSFSVEEALAQLPPIDLEPPCGEEVTCTCKLIETKSDFSIDEDEVDAEDKFAFAEDANCPARSYLNEMYNLNVVDGERINSLHENFMPNVNGNYSLGEPKPGPEYQENGLYLNVVPNVNNENLRKVFDFEQPASENFKKYSISDTNLDGDSTVNSDNKDASDNQTFKEWHEVVESSSYNGEILKILPYVIID